jgi:hypothetical protein
MAETPIDDQSHSAAFAAYGRVMAKIGAFEQFLRIALAQHEIDRCVGTGKQPNIQRLGKRLLKMDFGSLAQQLCDKFKLASDVRQVMKDAKGFRNNLAHGFWAPHFSNLHSDRGRTIIERQCQQLERQFEGVAMLLVQATGLDTAAYAAFVAGNANDEDVFRGWETRLDIADAALDDAEAGLASPPPQ